MNTAKVTEITKGTILIARGGRELTVLTKAPQDMGYYLKTPADPTFRVMVRGYSAFDLFYNQADLDSGAYIIKP